MREVLRRTNFVVFDMSYFGGGTPWEVRSLYPYLDAAARWEVAVKQ